MKLVEQNKDKTFFFLELKGRDSLIRIAFLNELTGALAEDRSCL